MFIDFKVEETGDGGEIVGGLSALQMVIQTDEERSYSAPSGEKQHYCGSQTRWGSESRSVPLPPSMESPCQGQPVVGS